MSAFWAEHAWLPTGLVADVRFEVVDGRFAAVHPRARPHDGERGEGVEFGVGRTARFARNRSR